MIPGDDGLLREIVEVRAKSGKIFGGRGAAVAWRESVFRPARVARHGRVIVGEVVIHTNRSLILMMSLVADVEVVVGIRTHGHHHHVGLGNVFQQEGLEILIDAVAGNLIVGELAAGVGKVGRTGGECRIVARIGDGRGRIVEFHRAHAEVALDFSESGDGKDLSIRLREAEAFIIHEEKGSLVFAEKWATEGSAEIVLHQVIVTHGLERAGIQRAVAEKFVGGAMILARPGAGDDVDLSAARAAHVSGVAAGDDLELHHGIGRGAEILRVEGWVGVGGAVKQEEVSVRTGAADYDGRALSRAPVQRIGLSRLGAETDVGAGNREDKIDQHATVEGQFLNGFRFDDLADGGVGGVKDLRSGTDLDTLSHGADL